MSESFGAGIRSSKRWQHHQGGVVNLFFVACLYVPDASNTTRLCWLSQWWIQTLSVLPYLCSFLFVSYYSCWCRVSLCFNRTKIIIFPCKILIISVKSSFRVWERDLSTSGMSLALKRAPCGNITLGGKKKIKKRTRSSGAMTGLRVLFYSFLSMVIPGFWCSRPP